MNYRWLQKMERWGGHLLWPVLGVCIWVLMDGSAGAGGTPTATQPEPSPAPENTLEKSLEQKLRASFPGSTIDTINPSEITGLYELVLGKNLAYTGSNGRFLLVGHLYDTQTGRDLTQERLDARIPTRTLDFARLPLQAAVKRGFVGGPKLAVFTDPMCPYCSQLHRELAQLKGVEIHEILFPVEALHPGAFEKSVAVLCSTDPAAALQTVMERGIVPQLKNCDAAKKAVQEALAYGAAHQIQATPTLVAADGRVSLGYKSAPALRAWLEENTTLSTKDIP